MKSMGFFRCPAIKWKFNRSAAANNKLNEQIFDGLPSVPIAAAGRMGYR
jgi:hypothetical protein